MSTEVLVAAYEGRHSIAQIAADWRMPESTVLSRLRKAGVVIRPPGARRSAVLEALREIHAMKETPC